VNAHDIVVATMLAGSTNPLGLLQSLVAPLIGCTITFVAIFWISLIIWTFRDIRSRTQDLLTQVLSTVLVAIFFVGGLFIYMILRPRQTLAEIYERQLEEESLLAEMTERQTCDSCHARVESDFQICPSCGHQLKRPCPKCERLLELRWRFCPYCSTNVSGTALPGASSVPGVSGLPSVAAMQSIPNNQGMPMGGNRLT